MLFSFPVPDCGDGLCIWSETVHGCALSEKGKIFLIVELKTGQELAPIHEAQLLSYLRLAGIERGLLINFHAFTLRDGIKRLSSSRYA